MMDTDTPKITRRLILFLALLTTSAALYAQTCKPVNGACPTITGVTCSFAATIEKGCNCYDNIDNDGDGQKDAADLDCAPYLTTYVGSGSTCTLPPPGTGSAIFTGVADVASASQNTADTPAHIAVGDMNGDGVPDAVVTSKFNRTIQVVATTKVTKCAAPVAGICGSSACTFASNIEKGCNCYDGIDNDGDGKVDMADAECSNMGSWKAGDIMSDYKTQSSNIFPSGGGGEWVFEHEMAIADIDGDGIGEMYTIASRRGSGNSGANDPPTEFALVGFKFAAGNGNLIPLFNGISLGPNRPGNPGLADFDGDGKAELYIRNQIYAAESGVKLADGGGDWKTAINTGSVAVDMDGDGKLDLVCGNFIYKMPAGGFGARTLQTMTIYKDMNVDFPTQKFYPKGYNDVNEYSITQASTTSVADFDVDGYPDVFITGAINCSGNEASPCGTNKTTIFYWNVHNNTLKTYFPPDPAYPLGWVWGTGRINLYDAYPNHQGLEALFMAGKSLFCLDNSTFTSGTPLWVRNTPNDALSGILSVTCYDFDNDGNPEIVYRDTQALTVCDGKTGQNTIWSTTCQSHTMTEGPIIADVNGDGATDICITCYSNTNAFDINKSTPQQQSLGQIHLYYTNSSTWLPTRKIWNQHPYFVVNVNDNMTLPTSQITQDLVFGNGTCPNGVQGPQRPLNLFMDQVPHLSASGCPEFPAPDITFYGDTPATGCGAVGGSSPPAGCDTNGDGKYLPTVVITPPICGNLGISAYFNIVNNGDLAISDNIPVSFFNGDPTANPVTATKLYSTTMNVTNLGIGGTFTSPTYTFNGPGNAFTLYVVIYNDGSVLPITLTGASTHECSISNNMYSTVISPSPFTVTTEVVQNNLNCPPYLVGNNGQVRSRVYIGATEQTDYSPYAFQWYDASQNPIAGATLYNLSNLDQGTYYVRVVNTQKGCSGPLVPVTVTRANPAFPAFTFTNVHEQTTCSPANGERIISAADGSVGYTYTWLDLALNPIGVTGADAKNLVAGTYSVQIQKGTCTCKDPVTGGPCATTSVAGPSYPDATATKLADVVDCQSPNSGSVTADALVGAVVQNPANYTFDWYFYNAATSTRGSILPAANGTGQTRTGLAAGSYQVVVTDNATKCAATTSPTATVSTSTVVPTANITQVQGQTSCDPNQPNGILTATGTAAGYTSPTDFKFEWFRGDNTLAANLIPIAGGPETLSGAKGETLNKAKGGGVIYTVRVTTPLNCQATNKLTLTETIIQPVVTLTQTPNDICDPAKTSPSVLYDGTVTAAVTFNGISVTIPDPNYTFNWYDGTTTTTAHNPATSTTSTLTGLQDNKFFTVVANRNDLHCSSTPQNIMVQKASVQPVLQATSTGSNNCDPALTPDGTATVNIVTSPLPAGHTYTYQWSEINPVTGVVIAALGAANNGTSQTAIKLGGPFSPNKQYMVDVIDRTNGCENTTTQSVSDVSVVPVLTTSTTPNSICSPATAFNGTMTATITNIPAGYTISDYTFSWYNGNTTATAHTPASTAATLTTLDVGTYSVTGKNTKTGCISSLYTNNVIPAKIFPALQPASTGSNNCDPALTPDGTVSYSVTNTGSSPGPFIQQWYVGSGDPIASGLSALPAANNGTSVTAIKVGGPTGAPKSYTVLVTNTTTGCTNYTTASVPDNSVIPVLSTTTTPNSICAPATSFNGTMTASVTNIPAGYSISDYTFKWYNGNSNAAPVNGTSTSTLLDKLDIGAYTVEGTNTKTGCKSAAATDNVGNTKIFPALLPAATGSNNCDPLLTPDGTVSYSVTNTGLSPGPFSQQWYTGAAVVVGNELPAANNGTSVTAIKVGGPTGAPKPYTVLVTNTLTGCTNFTTASVPDNSVVPVLATSVTPNSVCDLTLGFKGTFTATLTNPVGSYVYPTDFSFVWKDKNGVVINPATPPTTSPYTSVAAGSITLNNLDTNPFTVIATNTKTGCVSAAAGNTVPNNKVYPSIAPSSTGSNNCVADGTVVNGVTVRSDGTATATPSGTAGPYNYQWFTGTVDLSDYPSPNAHAGTIMAGKTTQTLSAVGGPGGAQYTAYVVDQGTGCSAFATASVPDNSVKPILGTSTTPNDICSPAASFVGTMTATLSNAQAKGTFPADYTFTWSVGAPVTGNATLTKLDAGTYTVTATNNQTGCASAIATDQVLDQKTNPVLAVSSTGSNTCTTSVTPDGTAKVDVTPQGPGGTDTFAYVWTPVGAAPAGTSGAPTNTATSSTITKVGGPNTGSPGTPFSYGILVTNNRTQCFTNGQAQVQDLSVKPTFTLTPTDNSICTNALAIAYNGHVDAAGISHPLMAGSTITYTWYNADPVTSALILPANHTDPNLVPVTDSWTGLNKGNYAATVTITSLDCTSDPMIVSVKDTPVYPAFSVTPTPSTNCPGGADNGSISATVSNAGVNTFTFDWHKGNLVTDPAVASANLPTSTSISNQKGAQNYTVQATNNQTGCAANFTQALADNSIKPTFTLTIVDNDKCVAPKDGKATVTGLTDPNAIGGDTYTIAFTSTVSGPQTSASIDYLNQPASFATATVKNDRLGCTSAPVTNEIKDLLTYPTISTSVVNSTNCAGGNPNGSATVTGVVQAGPYEYRWYNGSSVGAPGSEINGVAPGGTVGITGQQGTNDFTVEVNLASTGCRGSKTITIQDASQLPLITPLVVTPNHNCTAPFDGTAKVDVVTPFTYRGSTITAPYTGFALTWSTAATTDNISALAAGSYTLQVKAIAGNTVTNNDDNCISNFATAVIVDQLTPPVVSSGFTAKQTSCGPKNGQMTASETSGSGSYNFDWYKGIGPVGAIFDNATATTTSTTAANLASSNYTVVVTNTVTRCATTQTTFLPDNIVPPTLALAQNTPVISCSSPDGSVQATIGVTSMAAGDFTIYYLNEVGNNSTTDPATLELNADKISTLPADLTYSNLAPGYYSSIVRDEITHCESVAQTVHVDDNTNKATISINAITKATFCNAGLDGAMDINVAGGVPGYTFEWHKDGPTNAGPYNFFAGSILLPTFADGAGFAATEDIAGQNAGLFTVVVRDSKGCGTVYSNSIPFQNAPHIGKVITNSTQCDVLAGDGKILNEIVGFSDYQIKIYAGTDKATAILTPPVATSPDYGNDGVDNDGDGLTDAVDPDYDAGGATRCTDGVDNDGDGFIDSADPDCDTGNIAICGDGIDNDGDGLIDSADPDCDGAGGFLKSLTFTATALNPGGYIIEIMDKLIPCPIYQSATIDVDALKPVVTLSVLTPNTSCTPSAAADGSLQITVDKDPLDKAVLAPVYRITGITGTVPPNSVPATDIATYPALYPYPVVKAVPKTLFSVAANGDPFTGGFGPDTYTVSVKEMNSGCSIDKVIAVPDQPKVPNLISFNVVDESYCAPNSNGSISITSVSPIDIPDYAYHWYTDATLTTQIYTAVGVPGATLNAADYAGWVNPTAGLGIGTRTYYVQGIRATGLGIGCPTPAVQVVVQDTHVTPQMVLTSLPNTSCDPTVGEGSISISTTTASGDPAVAASNYNYVLDPAGLNVASNNRAGTPATAWFTTLLDNTYLVRGTNIVSGCKTESNNTVQSSKFVSAITNFTSQDKLMCNPDGSITVTQITTDRTLTGAANVTYSGAAPTLANNYDFRWFRTTAPTSYADPSALVDNTATVIAGTQLTDGVAAGEYPTMGAGLFYVIGKHKTGGASDLIGQGCTTPPIQVNINDKHVNPTVTLAPFSDTSCNLLAGFEGSIDVTVTDASAIVPAPPAYDFNYSWTTTSTTTPAVTNPYTGALTTFGNLQDGDYTLTALDNQTGCQTVANTTIIKNVTPVFVNNYTVTPQLICNPSGDITITGITYKDRLGNPLPAPVANFSFAWTRPVVGSVGNATALLDNVAYPTIGADIYTVVATRTIGVPGNGCKSAPINIEIQDKSIKPVPALTVLSDTSCDPTAPAEGEIIIKVTDATAAPYAGGTYKYDWTGALVPTPPPAANVNPGNGDGDGDGTDGDNDDYKQLLAGAYNLKITNNITGCAAFTVPTIPKNSVPVFVQSVTSLPQILCDLVNGDGRLTVAKVTVDERTGAVPTSKDYVSVPGVGQGNIGDFTFTWSRQMVPAQTQTTTGNVLANASPPAVLPADVYSTATFGIPIGADTYTVVATRTTGAPGHGCTSAPFTAVIKDERINPVITLTPFSNTSCDNTAPEGEIKVKVTDANATSHPSLVPVGGFTFDYDWTGSPNAIPNSVGNNGNEVNDGAGPDKDHITSLLDNAAPYKIKVTNPTTLCFSNSTIVVPVNQTPVIVQSVVPTDAIICNPDGNLTVTQVTINTSSGPQVFDPSTPSGVQNLLTDFQFEWQRVGDANAYTEITNGAAAPAGAVLDKTTYVVGAPGSGFAAPFGPASYKVVARRKTGSPGKGCFSLPYTVVLQDKSNKPIVTLTPFANTSCSSLPGAFEGEIEVRVTDATVNNSLNTFTTPFKYNYTNWTTTSTTTPPISVLMPNGANDGDGSAADADGDNPKVLEDGDYTVTVVNPQTGCSSTGSTTIYKNSTPVFTQLVTPVDQILCTADGSLTVNQVKVIDRNGNTKVSGPDFNISDFQFTYDRGAVGTTVLPASASTVLNNGNYGAIGFGTYYVTATRVANGPGLGCSAPPYKVDILDKRIFPVVSLTPFANTSCSGVFEGEIEVQVTDASVNNVAHTFITPFAYTYDWTVSATPGVINGPVAGTNDGDRSGTDGDGDNPKALKDGNYTVSVTNTQTGCASPGSTTIYQNSTPVFTQLVTPTDQVLCTSDGKLIVNQVQVIDRNGTTKVSGTDFPMSDFVFTYDRGAVGTTVLGPNSPSTQLDNTNYLTIGFGTYFVTATRNSGSPGRGCSAAPYKVDILDKRLFPSVSLTPLANTSCDPAFFEGEIKVKVTDASVNIPAPLTGTPFTYNYTWPTVVTAIGNSVGNDGDGFGGGEPDGGIVGNPPDNDKDHIKTLQDGGYTVTVTNAVTGCASNGSTTIFKNSTPVFTQLVVPMAQVLCKPDGSLVVKEVKIIDRFGVSQSNLNGDFPLSDFAFSYDRTTVGNNIVAVGSVVPPQPVITLDNTTYPTIGFDTYYVTATRVNGFPGKDCASAPYRVDIADDRIYPTLKFGSIANSACNVAKPNGSVQAIAAEPNGTNTDPYTFTWTLNGNPVASVVPTPPTQTDATPQSTLTNALDGAYIATVLNTNTGCTFAGSFNLLLDQTRSTPNIIDVATQDPIDCNPTAGAQVTKITLGSTFNSSLQPPQIPPDNTVTGALLGPPRFAYTWYEGSLSNPLAYTTLPCIGPNCATPTTGLLSGDHFVTVTDSQTDCQSGPKEFVIKTDNIIYPVASITQTVKQISCIATIGTAELQATASETDGTTGASYNFTWYPSLDLTGTAFGAPTAPSATNNPNVLQKLVVGNYSVQVKNNITSCTAQALFIVPDDSPLFVPALSTGTTPQTFCVGADGDAQVRILLDPAYPLLPYDNTSFTTDLYKGATPNLSNPPDVQANIPFTVTGSPSTITYDVPGLSSGFYTFRVTDKNTGCFRTDSVNIKLLQKKPVIVIVQDNPMKNCDPVIADGQLSATADGGKVQGYTFDWYAGTSVTGSILQTDNKLIGQRAGQYTVRTTVNVTGCFDDKTGTIDDSTVNPPAPIATTLHNQSNCVSPNGAVTATVGGVTLGYSFQWYNGQYSDKSKLPSSVDFKFADYTGLDVGFYSVTATDDVTHCVSQPASTPVIDVRVQPEYTIEPTPSYCADTGRPKGNGTFTLTSEVGVAFEDITWTLAGDPTNVVGLGPYVAELWPGDYQVMVTTVEGCKKSENASIVTEIKPYNLVSTNNDGQNDAFVIDCISNFTVAGGAKQDNNVKIFNRNGTLVYEANGYDNQTVFFRGVGEKGVYLSDKELPEGTYFYIIDKKNGTKPKTGFLELVR